MRVLISLPLPFDAWDTYGTYVKRFCDTFREFDPGHPCEIWAVENHERTPDDVKEWFKGLPVVFSPYNQNGCDLGGHQSIALDPYNKDTFIVGMTSRCYFYRDNWLRVMMNDRKTHGRGLYGCSASREGGDLHICTRAFGMDASLWREYPYLIETRGMGPFFEVGTDNPVGSLYSWVKNNGWNVRVVHWRESFNMRINQDWYFESKNRFRDGDQSQMLVHDYHTDYHRDAKAEVKRDLESKAKGDP